MKLEISEKEHDYLRTMVGMDDRLKNERFLNAAATRAKEFRDPDIDICRSILEALKVAQFDALMENAMLSMDLGSSDNTCEYESERGSCPDLRESGFKFCSKHLSEFESDDS